MKAYEVYHDKVSEGIPVTFKNDPKPHIIIWSSIHDDEGCPFIEITTEGWDEKNLPTKIENVDVVQKPEGYVIKPSLDFSTNEDDQILVFWRFTTLRGCDVKIYNDILTGRQNIILGTWNSSYSYDAVKIAGVLAVLPSGQSLLAVTTDKYKNEIVWELWNGIWSGNHIAVTNKNLKKHRDAVKKHR